jgi:hypothetical protein
VAIAILAGCGGEAREEGRLHAVVINPRDTLEFAAKARGRRCGQGRGFLLEGIAGGSGVLLWVHSGDSIEAGEYTVLTFGDTTTPHGVVAAARFLLGQTDRGVTLDSGAVQVTLKGGRIDATATGSGIDPAAGERVGLRATFHNVVLASETVGCEVRELR